MFRCSECGKKIGRVDGYFICHRTGEVAQRIPQEIVSKKTPPLPNWLRPDDLSKRARKEKKEKEAVKPLEWSI